MFDTLPSRVPCSHGSFLPGMFSAPIRTDSLSSLKATSSQDVPSGRRTCASVVEGKEYMCDGTTSTSTSSMHRLKRQGTTRVQTGKSTGVVSFDHAVSIKKVHADMQLKADIRFLIMPWSRVLTIWRTVMVGVVLWAIIFAPFELAFSWWSPTVAFNVTSRLVDVFCIVDMLMNFFIVPIKYGRLVTKRRAIARAYLKSWFSVDLLTNIPWDLLLHSSGKSRKLIKVLKLPKVLRLTRLLRVAREEAHTLGTVFTISGMLLLAHYFSCLWTFLLIDCEEGEQCPGISDAYTEGLSVGVATLTGSDAWIRFIIEGSYFDWQSPPGIGVEFAAIGTCLTGLCAMGMLFANIARAMDKQDSHTRKFNERLRNVQAAANQHAMSKDIFSRARRHFHYVWSCGSDASRELLADCTLSADLRRELAFSFYGEMLRKVPFLENAEENLLKQLCRYANMEVFSPLDNIIMAGESGNELFFLVVGVVSVINPVDDTILRTLDEGSFFGEVALFNPDRSHAVNVKALTFGWLLILHRDHLTELCDEGLLEAFKTVATQREEHEFVNLGRTSGYIGTRNPVTPSIIAIAEEETPDIAEEETPAVAEEHLAKPRHSTLADGGKRPGNHEKQSSGFSTTRPNSESRARADCQFDVEAFASHMEAKIDLWAGSLEKRLGSLDVRGLPQATLIS